MKVLFCTNLPAPYRVDFFNELGKLCDLTVCYERKTATDRDVRWKAAKALTYKEVYLDLKPIGADRSRGSALRKYIATHLFDRLILTNYVSPATMEAITYCKLKHIPYWIEYDGGFDKTDSAIGKTIKLFLLKSAYGHLTTCNAHINYLTKLGIDAERIYKYPFTSISEDDLYKIVLMMAKGKEYYRMKLKIKENKVIISVGQFIHRKGFDLLIKSAKEMLGIGVYIIGGEPTKELLSLAEGYNNIHFIGFKMKEELAEYYYAADMMVLLTREDIWGLVVNEAMAFGLPVITTDHCIAGLEMVRNGQNGYIVPANTYQDATKRIEDSFSSPELLHSMSAHCLETIKEYTIEKMALRHMEIFNLL